MDIFAAVLLEHIILCKRILLKRLLEQKVQNINKVKPDIISTGNIGCITQIASGIDIPIIHTIEIIDWFTGGPKPVSLNKSMKKILITRKLLRENEERALKLWTPKLNLNDEIYSQKKLLELSEGCNGILSSLTDKIDEKVVKSLPDSIKIISNFAVGFGNIDLEAAKKKKHNSYKYSGCIN